MKVTFRTNLDLIPADSSGWPTELPFRPMVGDFVSRYDSAGFRFEYGNKLVVEAELGVPPSRYQTLRDFYNFYEKLTGRKFL